MDQVQQLQYTAFNLSDIIIKQINILVNPV